MMKNFGNSRNLVKLILVVKIVLSIVLVVMFSRCEEQQPGLCTYCIFHISKTTEQIYV